MPKNHLYWILVTLLVSIFSAWCADPYAGNFRFIVRTVRSRAIRPISERELFDAGVAGLLAAVDENSSYIPPRRYEKLNQEFIQEMGSIGVLFYQTADPVQTWVGATEPRSAARLGGVLPGDEIIAINGVSLKNDSYGEVYAKLQAPVGTEVSLELFRPATQKKLTVLLVSQSLPISSVTGFARQEDGSWSYHLPQIAEAPGVKPKKIFYIRIEFFGKETVKEMYRILRQGDAENADGLVLDLTGNGGGLYREAVDVCGMFLPDNKLPCIYLTGEQEKPLFSRFSKIWKKPVVVLIDHDTASAAELLAACLQDYGEDGVIQAICIGERSFGKGTIQDVIDLGPIPDDRRLEYENDPRTLWDKIWKKVERGGIRISTSEFLRANGRKIHRTEKTIETDGWGVSPNPGWDVAIQDPPGGKANDNKFKADRLKFERLRQAGALPLERWSEIYKFDPLLKQAVEVFDDVPKNFSPKTSDQ